MLQLKNKLKSNLFNILFFTAVCPFFLFPAISDLGLIISIVLIIVAGVSVYLSGRIEVLIVFLLFSNAVKVTPLNPLPSGIDMTVLFIVIVFGGIIIHFLIGNRKIAGLQVIDIVFILLVILITISYFFAPPETSDYSTFKLIKFGILAAPFYFLSKIFVDKKQIGELTFAFSIVGSLLVFAIQFVFRDKPMLNHVGTNYLNFGVLAGVTFFFLMVMFHRSKTIGYRLLIMISMLACLILAVKTTSRGTLLSLMITFSFYIVISYRKYKLRMIAIFASAASVAFVFYLLMPELFYRFELIFKTHKGGSINARFELYSIAFDIIRERWTTGVGLGGFLKYHFLQHPHNVPIEIFCEQGIAGFMLVVTLFCYFGWVFIRSIFLLPRDSIYLPYYLSGFFTMLFHLNNFALESSRPFMFFMGMSFHIYITFVLNREDRLDKKSSLNSG